TPRSRWGSGCPTWQCLPPRSAPRWIPETSGRRSRPCSKGCARTSAYRCAGGTSDPPPEIQLRAVAHWLVKTGIVQGKKVGVFDGALGLVFNHTGEENSGLALSPFEQTCWRYWTDTGGKPPQKRDWAQGAVLRESFDMTYLFAQAMAGAGANLTQATLVAGMETIRDAPAAYHTNQTFTRSKHWGATQNVPQRWFRDCKCWKMIGQPWAPLYAPY